MCISFRRPLALLFPVFLFLGVGCGPSEEARLLPGEWNGISWMANGSSSGHDAAGTKFHFLPEGRYTYTYGELVEEGSWFVTGQELYTTPDGGTKMMVRIVRIDADTLVFAMNRGGTPETLTLVRAR